MHKNHLFSCLAERQQFWWRRLTGLSDLADELLRVAERDIFLSVGQTLGELPSDFRSPICVSHPRGCRALVLQYGVRRGTPSVRLCGRFLQLASPEVKGVKTPFAVK